MFRAYVWTADNAAPNPSSAGLRATVSSLRDWTPSENISAPWMHRCSAGRSNTIFLLVVLSGHQTLTLALSTSAIWQIPVLPRRTSLSKAHQSHMHHQLSNHHSIARQSDALFESWISGLCRSFGYSTLLTSSTGSYSPQLWAFAC